VTVYESLPISLDTLNQRALVEKVDALFWRLLRKDLVLRELRMDPWLAKADRRFALQVAQTHADNTLRFNNAAWNVVRSPGGTKEAYALALQQAEAAAQAMPWRGEIIRTFGIAQYRAGLYGPAEATLTFIKDLKSTAESKYVDLAFLAMAQHQLGKQ